MNGSQLGLRCVMLNGVGLWMGSAGFRWFCGLEISDCVWPYCQRQEWTHEGNRIGVGVGSCRVPYIPSPTSASSQVWCQVETHHGFIHHLGL